MSFWAQFWTWFLVFGVAVFLGLAIVVSIGGFFDVRALFRSLRDRRDQELR